MRLVISILGALILYFLSLKIDEKIQQAYQLDKATHILMSICVALFISRFTGSTWTIMLFTLAVGVGWEAWQFYHDYNVPYIRFNMKNFLFDSAGDIIADVAGIMFFFWWIKPHLSMN